MVYDPNFHELEYFVPLEHGPDALSAMRELMLRSLPDSMYPLEVRTVGPDDAYLSPNYKTATTVISVSGTPGTDYWDYLRSVDALLSDFSARVHWGKLHFLTPERLHALYPEADAFIDARRELDPERSVPERRTCASCSPDGRPSVRDRRDREVEPRETLGVEEGVDRGDLPVCDRERHHREQAAAAALRPRPRRR